MQLFIPLDAICSCTSAHATFKYRVIKKSAPDDYSTSSGAQRFFDHPV